MPVRLLIFLTAGMWILLGCSSKSAVQQKKQTVEQWFCEMNQAGEGWDCVQDENLARSPAPKRLPNTQAPDTQEPDAESDTAESGTDSPIPLFSEATFSEATFSEATTDVSSDDTATTPTETVLESTAQEGEETVPPSGSPASLESSHLTREHPPDPGPDPGTGLGPDVTTAHSDSEISQPPQPHPSSTSFALAPPDHYVVQLVAMYTPEEAEAFIGNRDLPDAYTVKTLKDGQEYYVVILGTFRSHKRAQQAADSISATVEVEPWIRTVASLHSAMQKDDADRR